MSVWKGRTRTSVYVPEIDFFPLGAGDKLPHIKTRWRTPGPCTTSRRLTGTGGAPREETRAPDAPGNRALGAWLQGSAAGGTHAELLCPLRRRRGEEQEDTAGGVGRPSGPGLQRRALAA